MELRLGHIMKLGVYARCRVDGSVPTQPKAIKEPRCDGAKDQSKTTVSVVGARRAESPHKVDRHLFANWKQRRSATY